MFSSLSTEGIVILICIVIGLLFALGALAGAWVKLRAEAAEVRRLQSEELSVTTAEVIQRLQLNPDLDTSRFLRTALDTGQIDLDLLSFYERIHWARYWAGVFVFIGLLGTVWGVSVAISNLGIAVSASNVNTGTAGNNSLQISEQVFNQSAQLQHSIDGLLYAIKSASMCTLFGIAATLIVSFCNSLYIAGCRAVEHSLVGLANRDFIPIWKKNSSQPEEIFTQRAAIDNLAKVTASLKSTINEFTAQMIPAAVMVTSLATHTEDVAQQLAKAAGAMEAALHSLADERGGLSTASGVVSQAASDMSREIRTLREGLAKSQLEQDTRQKEAIQNLEGTHKSLRDLLRHFESVLNDVSAIAEASPMRQELQRVKAELFDLLSSMEKRMNTDQERHISALRSADKSSPEDPLIRRNFASLEDRVHTLETGLNHFRSQSGGSAGAATMPQFGSASLALNPHPQRQSSQQTSQPSTSQEAPDMLHRIKQWFVEKRQKYFTRRDK